MLRNLYCVLDRITEILLGPFDHHINVIANTTERRHTQEGYPYLLQRGNYYRCRQSLAPIMRHCSFLHQRGFRVRCYNNILKEEVNLFTTDVYSIEPMVVNSYTFEAPPTKENGNE